MVPLKMPLKDGANQTPKGKGKLSQFVTKKLGLGKAEENEIYADASELWRGSQTEMTPDVINDDEKRAQLRVKMSIPDLSHGKALGIERGGKLYPVFPCAFGNVSKCVPKNPWMQVSPWVRHLWLSPQ